MADPFTTEDLFSEIDGRDFSSYSEFEQEVIVLFNRHLGEFPPHYSYRDAIVWADRNHWLHPTGRGFTVDMRKPAPA